MIFLDTNLFLRYVVEPSPDNPHGERQQAIAADIFSAVEEGREEVTTSEVVLHEVCFVLSSRRHYHLPAAEIAALGPDHPTSRVHAAARREEPVSPGV